MKPQDAVLAACLAVTPARLRPIREEQWRADLLDGPRMGISTSELLFAAAYSSVASRIYDLKHRGAIILSRITKGENMKPVLGALGAAAVLAAVVAGGIQANATTGQDVDSAFKGSVADRPIAGYEGWWNSATLDGTPTGPEETVAFNTNTGKIVDYSNWRKAAAGQQLLVADAHYAVVPDPAWPASSIVIIDMATGKAIEDFPVDERGRVIRTREDGSKTVG